MLVKISEDRFVNTDHIIIIEPSIEAEGKFWIQLNGIDRVISLEDRDLILKSMESAEMFVCTYCYSVSKQKE